jgi:hypothetical protein
MHKFVTAASVAMLCMVSSASCGAVTITTFSVSAEDHQAEENYKTVWSTHMTQFQTDSQPFAASSSNPGVCNIGGSQQGCFDATTQVIAGLQAMIAALEITPVPPRYVEPDRAFRAALTQMIQAMQSRNQALSTGDDTLWQQSNTAIQTAVAAIHAAYQTFPLDNRPVPGP